MAGFAPRLSKMPGTDTGIKIRLILKTSVQATNPQKPLTAETQRKTWNQLFFKDFLCVSVVN
jgi:hypothetical protein